MVLWHNKTLDQIDVENAIKLHNVHISKFISQVKHNTVNTENCIHTNTVKCVTQAITAKNSPIKITADTKPRRGSA